MFKVALIDSDTRRRAKLTSAGLKQDVHVEPFETLVEAISYFPSTRGILMHDHGDLCFQEMQRHLASASIVCPIVAYGNPTSLDRAVKAIRARFADYLSESLSEDAILMRALQSINSQEPELEAEKDRAEANKLVGTLSNRETEVLDGVVSGESNKDIAQRLNISPRTVEIHRANMSRKLDANGTADVVRIAIQAGRNPNVPLNRQNLLCERQG